MCGCVRRVQGYTRKGAVQFFMKEYDKAIKVLALFHQCIAVFPRLPCVFGVAGTGYGIGY